MKTNQIVMQNHDRPRQTANAEKRDNTMKGGASTITKPIEKQAKRIAKTSKPIAKPMKNKGPGTRERPTSQHIPTQEKGSQPMDQPMKTKPAP